MQKIESPFGLDGGFIDFQNVSSAVIAESFPKNHPKVWHFVILLGFCMTKCHTFGASRLSPYLTLRGLILQAKIILMFTLYLTYF